MSFKAENARPVSGRRRRGGAATVRRLVLALILMSTGWTVQAELPTREEVLAAMFPGASARRETVFLSEAERLEVEKRSGARMETSLVGMYRVIESGREVARAYVDTHIVRTKKQSLLIVVDREGNVQRVETTAFLEPPEYQAPRPWLDQYSDRTLSDQLSLNRSINPLAGATLTARAANQAVRRVLALDQVLGKRR